MKSIFPALLCALFTSPLFAAEVCSPVDLSNQSYSPFRNQIYSHAGVNTDSQFCHAMSLANLIGQAVGVAVSPDDIGYQAIKADPFNEGIGDLPFGAELPGSAKEDWDAMAGMGFCKQRDINSMLMRKLKLTSTQATYAATNAIHSLGFLQPDLKVNDMTQALEKACPSRVQLPSQVQLEILNFEPGTPPSSTQSRLLQKTIDEVLNKGQYLTMTYRGHYVTIVGRTADCNYLIQDSIPQSFWTSSESFANSQKEFERNGGAIKFLGEHLQAWPSTTLLRYTEEITYLKN